MSEMSRKRFVGVGDIGVFGFIQWEFFALANIVNPIDGVNEIRSFSFLFFSLPGGLFDPGLL